jgi:hypothetical protein
LRRLLPLVLLAACAGEEPAPPPPATPEPVAIDPSVDLRGVCPETVVVQTDWFPEAEYGATYELVGEPATIDASRKVVRGPLVTGGKPTGVQIEVRTGGPAIGNQKVVSTMRQDDSILLGYVTTDEAIENYVQIPTVAVVAPLEINPQVIYWDPATYPDVKTIADLKSAGVTVRYFQNSPYMTYLSGAGILAEAQLDGSYDGSPAVFVAEGGTVAQQGFASAEPYTYEHQLPQWGKPLAFQLIHETGWQIYAQPLAIRKDKLAANEACLTRLVPMVQRAVVDFAASPDETIGLIVKAVREYKDFWLYSAELGAFSVQQQKALGLIGNGPNATVGDFDEARIEALLPKARAVFGSKVPADLTAADLFTNAFVDPSIAL